MASIFKTFLDGDVARTRNLLHEAIPITGSIVSGSYAEENIKEYTHGMFQSVYDYPYLSSSANHIFDITCGVHSTSSLYAGVVSQQAKKANIYNQMAQVLMGYDSTSAIKLFQDEAGTTMDSVFFMNFSRLLVKDEIKKGSVSLTWMTGGAAPSVATPDGALLVTDSGSVTNYRVDAAAGEYGYIYDDGGNNAGLVFYQAGVAVFTSSLFIASDGYGAGDEDTAFGTGSEDVQLVLQEATIGDFADGLRFRIRDISFNNTTELNSTIYFCRANHSEFNYSSNPTYLSGTSSKIMVKENTLDEPVSYITTIGLYSADNELLAVAKVSEALKKTPQNELTMRVRLDY
tara:strand:+ start:9822 stop:10856 length:1035 start_codon:yes stop_codon:yes gene_type:complete